MIINQFQTDIRIFKVLLKSLGDIKRFAKPYYFIIGIKNSFG